MQKPIWSLICVLALTGAMPATAFAQDVSEANAHSLDCALENCAPATVSGKATKQSDPSDKSVPQQGASQEADVPQNDTRGPILTVAINGPRIEQDYEINPAIWLLSDEDTSIYLFGTIHVLPPNFSWRSDALNAVIAKSDELVVESTDEDIDSTAGLILGRMMGSMFDPDAQTVSARLSKENRRKWFKLAKLSEIPASYFDRIPLIITMLGMGMANDVGQGSSAKDGVETVLQADFEAAEKPISSIEDAAMVLQSLLDLDEDPLIAEVDGYLTNWDGKSIASLFAEPVADGNDDADDSASAKEDGASPDPFAMEHVWARGEGAPDIVEIFNATESGRQLYETLLVDRNRAWAQWLDDRLDAPGTLLVAVGAGHFEGDDSVQAMLEARGLNAKRIH